MSSVANVDSENSVTKVLLPTGMRQVTVEDGDIMTPNISFPMLREITDFLVVFKAKRLKSLGGVFPNLSVT